VVLARDDQAAVILIVEVGIKFGDQDMPLAP
jgi:hypothetical protein